MKRVVLVLLVAAVSGCTSLTVGPDGVRANAEVRSLGALIALGVLAGAAIEDARHPRPFPSLSHTLSEATRYEPPPLAEDRPVSVQDCTRPVDYTLGNIRCK